MASTSKNKIIGVYKVTNPIGEVYIGQSTHIQDRWHAHKNSKDTFCRILKESIIKYGSDSHVFEILEECEREVIKERERFWQEEYFLKGVILLNCVLPKKYGYPTRTAKSTKRLHIERTIRIHTGLKRSDESRDKMRNAAKGRRKPVMQYDLQMNPIKQYISAMEATRSNPGLHYSHIKGCCKGKSKTHGGFIWKYITI